MAVSPSTRADEKQIEQWKRSTWRMGIALHAPHLVPPAVQWAVMDHDPLPGFAARVKQVKSQAMDQIDKAGDEEEKETARTASMTVSWDLGFKDVKGDNLYLLTSAPIQATVISSNGPDGKKWIVTKTVRIKGKPACWCLPVEVKTGREVHVTLSEDNLFDLASTYEKAMGKTGREKEATDIAAFAKARVEAAQQVYDGEMRMLGVAIKASGQEVTLMGRPEDAYIWSIRWLNAQRDMSSGKDNQVAALEDHLTRMKALKQKVSKLPSDLLSDLKGKMATRYYVAEAEFWLAQEKAK